MKKIYLILIAIVCIATGSFAQQVPLYHFGASNGAYTPITTGGGSTTVFTSSDSIVNKTATALPIGFTFNYNGTAYSTFGICSDGWISMGSTAPFFASTGNTTPVSESGTSNNIICGFGYKLMGVQNLSVMSTVGSNVLTAVNWDPTKIVDGDHIMAVAGKIPGGVTIVSHTATTITMSDVALATYSTAGGFSISVAGQGTNTIQYQTIGTAPNRKLVVQYTNFSRWIQLGSTGTFFSTSTVGGNMTFQIILNETTNAINTVYNTLPISTVTNSASDQVQVGLKGASNTEFNIRSTSTNWGATTDAASNSSFCSYSSSVSPAIGQTFTWTPPVACSAVVGGTSSTTTPSICSGLTTTITCLGATSDVGITSQWQVATTPGGPYINVTGGTSSSTQSSSSYTTATLTSPNTVNTHFYFVLKTTCINGGATALSNEVDVTVKGLPNITITPSTGTICSNGTGLPLVASGASTYSWAFFTADATATSGLSSTTIANPTANPTTNTTYTVTGTDATGCTNTNFAKINVAQLPAAPTVSATPTTICNGSNTSLSSSAVVLGSNQDPYPTDLIFTGSTGTFTSIRGLSGTVLLSSITGDNVGSAAATALYLDGQSTTDPGFVFKYNRVNFSKISVNTNGVMKFWTSGSFGSGATNALWNVATGTFLNTLAPFWDDNYIGATANSGIYIQMTGSAPNRITTIEWNEMSVGTGASAGTGNTISVQVKLYETTNVIQFIYGPTSGTISGVTATIGLNGKNGSYVGNFVSITPQNPPSASTISNTVENNSISDITTIPSGTTYTFTPPTWPLSYTWTTAADVENPINTTTQTKSLLATEAFNMAVNFRGCSISAGTPATVTVNSFTTLAATAGGAQVCNNTYVLASNGTTYSDGSCNIIATVKPAGASPVSGVINTCVKIEPISPFPTYNSLPYVQRHYDIEPAVNASTATANVVLYFTDAEFVNYNANKGVYPALPTVAGGGNVDPNIINVYVSQFHGTGTMPGTYSGAAALKIPTLVYYNSSTGFWEVTVSVNGFSGFFINSINFPLPLAVNNLKGIKNATGNSLSWSATCNNASTATIVLERSSDGRNFNSAGIYSITVDAARCGLPFNYTDDNVLNGTNYYRLRITDNNGKINYSNTIAILNSKIGFEMINISPNPVNVTGAAVLSIASAVNSKLTLVVSDLAGKKVITQIESLVAGSNTIPMNFTKLSAGTYQVTAYTQDGNTKTLRFVIQ